MEKEAPTTVECLVALTYFAVCRRRWLLLILAEGRLRRRNQAAVWKTAR